MMTQFDGMPADELDAVRSWIEDQIPNCADEAAVRGLGRVLLALPAPGRRGPARPVLVPLARGARVHVSIPYLAAGPSGRVAVLVRGILEEADGRKRLDVVPLGVGVRASLEVGSLVILVERRNEAERRKAPESIRLAVVDADGRLRTLTRVHWNPASGGQWEDLAVPRAEEHFRDSATPQMPQSAGRRPRGRKR